MARCVPLLSEPHPKHFRQIAVVGFPFFHLSWGRKGAMDLTMLTCLSTPRRFVLKELQAVTSLLPLNNPQGSLNQRDTIHVYTHIYIYIYVYTYIHIYMYIH